MGVSGRSSGSPDSDFAEIQPGLTEPVAVIRNRPEETLELSMLRLEYSSAGSAPVQVTLYDEEDGTAAEDLEDSVDKFVLSPGDSEVITEATYRDVEDDLIALANGGNDALVIVTAGGSPVTG